MKYISLLLVQQINLGSNQGFMNCIWKLMRSDFRDFVATHHTFFMFPFDMNEQSTLFRPIFRNNLITKKKGGVH